MSEGAPIGFLWWALPTRLREAGVPLAEITLLTSLLAIPWALKFLWAPLVDILRTRWWTRRAWVIAAQVLMGVLLLPLLWLDLQEDLTLVTVLLLAHAVAAATQDVAVDALSPTSSTSPATTSATSFSSRSSSRRSRSPVCLRSGRGSRPASSPS